MSERVFPEANGNGNATPPNAPLTPPPAVGRGAVAPLSPPPGAATKVTPPPSFTPPRRPPIYRPELLPPSPRSPRRRRRSSCCCSCLLWSTVALVVIIVLLGLAVGIFYAIYHPKRPTFSVTGLRLSTFNLTASDQLFSRFDVNVSTRNPSRNGLSYVYNPISISAFNGEVWLGDGSFPAFVHSAGETRLLRASVRNDGKVMDAIAAKEVRKKSRLVVRIEIETEVGIKVGALKTSKVRIQMGCRNFGVSLPKGRTSASAATSPARSCHVEVKMKIWKWYL